jgi:uncharacterized membrane protein
VSFANPLPWWILLLIVGAAGLVASLAYSRRRLPPAQRLTLVLLRMATLLALVLFLMRPVSRAAAPDAGAIAIPVLVDTSKSMAIEDAADGRRRIDLARELVTTRIVPALGPRFSADVLAFGETLTPGDPERLSATARRSDLAGALAAVRERYRGRQVPGVILVSDGGDTSGGAEKVLEGLPPIFAVGVGSPAGKDREILSVTVAEQILDESRVDLAVSAVSRGFGQAPIELRLLENGRAIDIRRVTPAAEGVPVRQVFQVTPGRTAATVYTVETPSAGGELVPENNARSVLVQPPARRRRVLLIAGAPGFEHSFLKRAWAADRGLEIDSVVRKGKDEKGTDTFYIQAGRERGPGLITGYPATREALYFYDAIVLANVEPHQLTRTQLEATQAFVGRRGGGLLVLGARAFVRQGFGDTPIEEVLPLEPAGRGDAVPAADVRGTNEIVLTAAGEAHPIMQVAPAIEETRRRWNALPALASVSALGGPRPGASVLAVAGTGGAPRALIAVQRYGEGRSMVFTGEASWRWRMMMPATDRVYDTFWKQSLRWIALGAADPTQILTTPNAAAGEPLPIRVVVRNAGFEPQADAAVSLRVTTADGRTESVTAAPDPAAAATGHYLAAITPAAAGLLKIAAEARRGAAVVGTASHTVLVGGADAEMADPRLNRQLLDRLTAASGGRVVEADGIAGLPGLLAAAAPRAAIMGRRDLWHNGWSFAAILLLLGAEWLLRRRWGLR